MPANKPYAGESSAEFRKRQDAQKMGEKVETDAAVQTHRSVAGKGLGERDKGEGMPKPEPGENALTPAYRERVRVWREKRRGSAQGKVIDDMLKK